MSQTQVAHSDSIDSQDPHKDGADKKAKSRRPPNTAFRQQRLKAWQPILTPKTVLPLFFAVGIIFAPIGGLLLWTSAKVQELRIDYSDCATKAPQTTWAAIPGDKVTMHFNNDPKQNTVWRKVHHDVEVTPGVTIPTTTCQIQFEIPDDIGPPVFFYYRLTNFYQNHRRYVKSLDTDQLKGNFIQNSTISGGSCDPLRLDENGKAYYPCGLIANSLFNDTFYSPVMIGNGNDNQTYPMTNKGIAWGSDASLYGKTKYTPDQVSPPPNWAPRYPKGYTEENLPDLHTMEEFQVWMRTAGLPTFSKLALRNDNQTMKAGNYQVNIDFHFNVTEYSGTKAILISTRTVMGGKNPFLGIAYVVIGGLCVLMGALFTAAHLIKPRKLGDHTYLTWNNDQPSTATASGREVRPGA